jgi:hypothetical protein
MHESSQSLELSMRSLGLLRYSVGASSSGLPDVIVRLSLHSTGGTHLRAAHRYRQTVTHSQSRSDSYQQSTQYRFRLHRGFTTLGQASSHSLGSRPPRPL